GLGARSALARHGLPAVRRRASQSLGRGGGVAVLGRVDVLVGLLVGFGLWLGCQPHRTALALAVTGGLTLLRTLGRRRRCRRGGSGAVAFLAGERARRRLDAVLLQPLSRLALGAAPLTVTRCDLRRDRWQRRKLVPLLLLRGEL